jgi:hypothetical protein
MDEVRLPMYTSRIRRYSAVLGEFPSPRFLRAARRGAAGSHRGGQNNPSLDR